MHSEAKIMDFDNTLAIHDKTVLMQLALDYINLNPPHRANLKLRGLLVKNFMRLMQLSLKYTAASIYFTGETTQLNVFDFLFLRKAQIPWDFVRERASIYADYIPLKYRHAVRNAAERADLYIISSEPVQLVSTILDEAELLDCFKDIRGNHFVIKEGVITGLRRIAMLAGSRGKYFRLSDLSKKYDLIRTIGDDNSDIGLFTYLEEESIQNVEPYALDTGSKTLKDFLGAEQVISLEDFLKL